MQDLNLHRAWVQALLNWVVQQWLPLHHYNPISTVSLSFPQLEIYFEIILFQ